MSRLAILACALVAFPLAAHHSDAMYDLETVVTIRGVLTEVNWSNPHVELTVEGENESGEHATYVIETAWPGALQRNGLTRESFVAGESVEIQGHPKKEADRISAWGRTLIRPDGTVLSLPAKPNFTSLF